VRRHTVLGRECTAAIEHRRVEIEALDDKIVAPCVDQPAGKANFGVAIARTKADNAPAEPDARRGACAARFDIGNGGSAWTSVSSRKRETSAAIFPA
jgi:hypothetical protein